MDSNEKNYESLQNIIKTILQLNKMHHNDAEFGARVREILRTEPIHIMLGDKYEVDDENRMMQ